MNNFGAGIVGTGSYLPERILTNHELENIVDTSDRWIVERTGIQERRIANKSQATSDLSTIAAERALKDANLRAEDIELIILATLSGDHAFPATACIVQNNIGAKNAAAFDINAGCSGFIYGMTIAEGFIKSGMYKNVLVIGAETMSRVLNWEDRNTCILFGDGAGACILGRCQEDYGIISSHMGADGSKADVLMQKAGGSRLPASIETVEKNLHSVDMNGKEVFKFAVRVIDKASKEAVKKAKIELKDIDLLIPHQANTRIIDAAYKKLYLEKDKIFVNLNKYGNMSAASVPVAIDEAIKEKRLKKGDNLLLVAFGAGLTWASMVIKWNREEI